MKPEDLEPYQIFQLERYGNILPPVNVPTTQDETEEERRFSEWMQHEAEQQVLKAEEYFGCKQDLNL